MTITTPPKDSCCAFCGTFGSVEFDDTEYSRTIIDGKEIPIVSQRASCSACGRTYHGIYVWQYAELRL